MVCGSVIIINRGSVVAQGPIDSLVEQFFPTARVHVHIGGPAAVVRDGLQSIAGVLTVTEAAGDGGGFLVETAPGRDVRGAERAETPGEPGRTFGVVVVNTAASPLPRLKLWKLWNRLDPATLPCASAMV